MLSKPSNVTELKQFWIIPWTVNHLHTHSFITLDVMFMLLSLPDMKLHYGDLTDSTCLVKIINQVKPTEIYNLGAQSHVKVASSHLLFPVAHMNILLDNRWHCMYVYCAHTGPDFPVQLFNVCFMPTKQALVTPTPLNNRVCCSADNISRRDDLISLWVPLECVTTEENISHPDNVCFFPAASVRSAWRGNSLWRSFRLIRRGFDLLRL